MSWRSKLQERVCSLCSQFDALTTNLGEERERQVEARRGVRAAVKAQAIAQSLAEQVQQQVHKGVAGVVSRCLEAVFEEPYEFRIVFEQKRGKTEARMIFLRDGNEVDPMEASGGGVVDVAAFAVRLARLRLSRPRLRRVIILDEPFKYVSEEYRDNVRQLLIALSTELKFQIIMVTHIRELQCGTVVRIGKGGAT